MICELVEANIHRTNEIGSTSTGCPVVDTYTRVPDHRPTSEADW